MGNDSSFVITKAGFQIPNIGIRVLMWFWVMQLGLNQHQRLGQGPERLKIAWILLIIQETPEKDFEKESSEKNNSTKIDNPIFGVLQTFPP